MKDQLSNHKKIDALANYTLNVVMAAIFVAFLTWPVWSK